MIIFKSKHHPDIQMFDQIALNLLGAMGHSQSVPGALSAEEIPQAIVNLKKATGQTVAKSGDNWEEDTVSLSHRASPLLTLLETANKHQDHVLWEASLL